jgi:indole-3-glycerol phosphate synthase
MSILDTIIARKFEEVAERKLQTPISALENSIHFSKQMISLKQSILDPQRTGIIAEFKRKSPSKGIINNTADVVEVTKAYAEFGASGLSVLTDTDFFGGFTEDLLNARINPIPILRKDFIVDEYQIAEAKAMGADVILLIASCLTPLRVKELATFAKSLQLEILLELHNENELNHINEHIEIVGINNRNLNTFEVDIENSIRMAEQLGNAYVKVAESGIKSPEDVIRFKQYGFDGFLIGENFMKNTNPASAFQSFVSTLQALQ